MCTRREWTTAQWLELLLEHPVMGVLVTGLIWQSGSVLFRPVRGRGFPTLLQPLTERAPGGAEARPPA